MNGRLVSVRVSEEELLLDGECDGRRDGEDVDGFLLGSGTEGTALPPLTTVGDPDDHKLLGASDGECKVAGDAVGREVVGTPELFPEVRDVGRMVGKSVGRGLLVGALDSEGVGEVKMVGETVGP